MFPIWVEKLYCFQCVGEKSRLKLLMFSEAKLSIIAPSSASCEKQRGETGTSRESCAPWSQTLLKNEPFDHFKHATSWQIDGPRKVLAEELEDGAVTRETEENVGLFTALLKTEGQQLWSDSDEAVWNLSQEKDLYHWTSKILRFWRKT